MNKNIIIGIAAGLLVGIIGTVSVNAALDASSKTSSQDMGMMDHSAMSMSEMNTILENKTGNEFDKAFIEMMIAHHEGAIDMAELAETNAEREEIKTLSTQILDAQTTEIAQMKKWQAEWSYDSTSMPGMMH